MVALSLGLGASLATFFVKFMIEGVHRNGTAVHHGVMGFMRIGITMAEMAGNLCFIVLFFFIVFFVYCLLE